MCEICGCYPTHRHKEKRREISLVVLNVIYIDLSCLILCRDRDKVTQSIQKTISELGSVFGQMAEMVVEQRDMLTRIDENVSDTGTAQCSPCLERFLLLVFSCSLSHTHTHTLSRHPSHVPRRLPLPPRARSLSLSFSLSSSLLPRMGMACSVTAF